MNEFLKTGAFMAAAVGVSVFAYTTLPGGVENALFDDQGDIFFEGFTEAKQAATIQVYAFAEGTKEEFVVTREGDTWTIPSHSGYPADASEQMADAATVLIGLEKTRVRSDIKGDHAKFGVLDPNENPSAESGYGQRVIFQSDAKAVLADLIIGNEVEGSTGMRFVRQPGKKRVYEAKIEALVPTDFAEWIEKDVLKAQQADVAKIKWDSYSIDEQRGAIVAGAAFTAAVDDAGTWSIIDQSVEPGANPAEPATPKDPVTADTAKVQAAASSIVGMQIVGVRPKPPGLNERLERAAGIERQMLAQQLQSKGFFLDRSGGMFANEGDLYVHTKKGVVYTLRFGEVVYGSGKRVSAGADEGDAPETPEGEEKDGRPNRYLMVSVALDKEGLVKPEGVMIADEELAKRRLARSELEEIRRAIQSFKDQNDGALPDGLTALTVAPEEGEALLAELKDDPWGTAYQFAKAEDGSAFTLVSWGANKAEGGEGNDADVDLDMLSRENDFQQYAGALKAYESKLAEATEEVEALTKRFGPWYYVIDATSYDTLRPAMEDLIQKEDAGDAGADGQTPPFGPGAGGMPGIPGLPGGGR